MTTKEEKQLTGYCTRYALSLGIYAVTVKVVPGRYLYATDRYRTQLVIGRDFFESLDDAKSAARETAVRRIALLESQIEKLKLKVLEPKVRSR